MNWESIIGLEVHVQLNTQSKIFSGSATTFGAKPNTQACNIDLGLPGVLPVLNENVVKMAIKFGLAIGAKVAPISVFERKNYFYPDLPKGYQISQHEYPIVKGGSLKIAIGNDQYKKINITRAHLEEDAGKSIHGNSQGFSGVDLNRSGIPLLEIVSEPDMRSAAEAIAYLKNLHSLVKYLGICNGNMQEGSFRCDANVSVRCKGQSEYNTRTEIKNLNSFKFIEKAINFEIARQIEQLESNHTIKQETLLYDAQKNETRPMRSKEEANDYRYFPDPDLLPVHVSEQTMQVVRASLPELPNDKCLRFQEHYKLSKSDASLLTADKALADYYEATVDTCHEPKLSANWIISELLAALNREILDIESCPISAVQLGKLIQRIQDNTISGKIAKTVFEGLWKKDGDVDTIIKQKNLTQVTDSLLIEKLVDEVLAANPTQVESYQNGKSKLFGFFVGQVMRASNGKANPSYVNKLLEDKLKSH